ncbi:ALP1-like protein isoform X1 [Tanacetum coccineum]
MSDYESDDSDVQDFKDLDMIFELGRLEQQEQEEAERVHHRNYIYRERVEAEARLMADYFGPRPKYPDYYFRLRIDCMHWEWKNCPKAWHGQFGRGDKKYPTILLEAVASYDLWIWHAFFGVAGVCRNVELIDGIEE